MSAALIYGGAGQLGKIVVGAFKNAGWKVLSADFRASEAADLSIILQGKAESDAKELLSRIDEHTGGKLDAIITVAGGFGMGRISDDGVFAAVERMLTFNVISSVVASHVAAKKLKEGGLLVLTGAEGALRPTPHFVGYGISKAGTHHLLSSISHPEGGLPKGSTACAILPITLDTPQNRADMPTANFDNWTPLSDVAQLLVDWANGKNRPATGAKVVLKTENKKTSFVALD